MNPILPGAIVAFLCFAGSSPTADDNKTAEKLRAALHKANRLLVNIAEADGTAAETIRHSRVFQEPLKVTLNVTTVKNNDCGCLVATGNLSVRRGPPDRYRTQDEQRETVEMAQKMRRLRSLRARKLGDMKRRKAGWEWIRQSKMEFDKRIDQLQRDQQHRYLQIDASVEERRTVSESVSVMVVVPANLAQGVDTAKLLSKIRVEFVGLVRNFEVAHEPEQVEASQLRIEKVYMEAIRFDDEVASDDTDDTDDTDDVADAEVVVDVQEIGDSEDLANADESDDEDAP